MREGERAYEVGVGVDRRSKDIPSVVCADPYVAAKFRSALCSDVWYHDINLLIETPLVAVPPEAIHFLYIGQLYTRYVVRIKAGIEFFVFALRVTV